MLISLLYIEHFLDSAITLSELNSLVGCMYEMKRSGKNLKQSFRGRITLRTIID